MKINSSRTPLNTSLKSSACRFINLGSKSPSSFVFSEITFNLSSFDDDRLIWFVISFEKEGMVRMVTRRYGYRSVRLIRSEIMGRVWPLRASLPMSTLCSSCKGLCAGTEWYLPCCQRDGDQVNDIRRRHDASQPRCTHSTEGRIRIGKSHMETSPEAEREFRRKQLIKKCPP